MPRHLGKRAVRFLCRWGTRPAGVPISRPIAFVTAVAVVGGSFLETGAIAHTPISSSGSDRPFAALHGSSGSLDALGGWLAVGRAPVPRAVADDPMRPRRLPGHAATHVAGMRARAIGPVTRGGSLAALATIGTPDPSAIGGTTLAVAPELAPAVGSRERRGDRASINGSSIRTETRSRKGVWRSRRTGRWKVSPHVTWYGPGFYGNRTACGQRYTRTIVGVAHKRLPCGTMVRFRWHGMTRVAPVIDRGPYGPRTYKFDWSARLACRLFKPKRARNGCFTRYDVRYRVVGKVDLDRWFKRRDRR